MDEELIGGLNEARVSRPPALHGKVELVSAPLRRRVYPARVAYGFEVCVSRSVEPPRNCVNGTSFDVPSGSLLLVEPGTVWQARGSDSFRSLEIAPDVFEEWCGEALRRRPVFPPLRHDKAALRLARCFEHEHAALQLASDPLAAEERLHTLLAGIVNTCATAELRTSSAPSPAALERVRELLRRDYAARYSLAEIVHLAGVRVGKFQLMRSFRQRYGVTPHRYQRLARVAAAQALLRRGCSIAHAALEVGFHDQAHLTRSFVQVYGLTPSRFARGQPRTRRARFDRR